ncbi:hypothetical protein G6F37_011300 [Rhizopus arrhizus]|nr:hypothetical protein G6F38_011400 [Rhizopus arrhizus]KAG1149985.1 hypothetical protein G6F37_011300 [Rhizopus arrhizus]
MNPWQIFAQEGKSKKKQYKSTQLVDTAQTGSCTVSTCPTSNASVTSEYPTTDPPRSSPWHSEECDLIGFEEIEDQNTSDTGLPWRQAVKNQQEESEVCVTICLRSLAPNQMDPKESMYSASLDRSGVPPWAPSDPHRPWRHDQPNRSREESEDSHRTDQPSWLLESMDDTLASGGRVDDADPIVRYSKDEMHAIRKTVNATWHEEGIQAGKLIHMWIALEKSTADEQHRQGGRRQQDAYDRRSRSYPGHDHRDYRKGRERQEGEWVQRESICIDWDDYHDPSSDVERKRIFVPIRASKHAPENAQDQGFQSGVPIMSAVSPLVCLSCKSYAVV